MMSHATTALANAVMTVRVTFASVVLGLALAAPACGQQRGPMDEQAIKILESMSDHLAQAKTMSFRARSFFDLTRKSGIKIKAAREARVLIKRPDRLQATSISDDGSAQSAWYDGAKLTVWRRHVNEQMSLDFKGSTDALLDYLDEKYGIYLPLSDILYSNVADTFKRNIISSEYLGLRTVEGVPCHHLSFESTGSDFQIWIEADETPLPRRFAITYVTQKGEPQFLAHLDQWSIGAELPDDRFQAAIPAGVKSVPFAK